MDIMSPVVQSASSHEFLQDYCREHHPLTNTQKCAFVYSQAKAWEEFNQILNATHLDVLDKRNIYDPEDIDVNADEYFMYQGQIYTDFAHFKAHHWNIRMTRENGVLKAGQDKLF